METRKPSGKAAPLPVDYLAMVKEVFTTNFDAGLKALAKLHPNPAFEIQGAIHASEILISVSLIQQGQLAATTAYASVDFDPKASDPTPQDLLAACVDAIGAVFEPIFDPKFPERLVALSEESLSALQDVPYEWTAIEVDRFRIFVRVDKANPMLDQLADDWLKRNDPDRAERVKREQKETEKLFVTGPKDPSKTPDDDSGNDEDGPTFH